MEKKLSNEEIARVFAMYMPCDTVQDGNNFNRRLVAIGGFEDAGFCYGKLKNKASTAAAFVSNFQIILTSLSDITDEHKLFIYAMGYTEVKNSRLEILPLSQWKKIRADQHQQLIFWGYSVPLYFGFNHWANGMDAISLNIAIKKKSS